MRWTVSDDPFHLRKVRQVTVQVLPDVATKFRTHEECVSPIASPGIAASRMDIDTPPPSAIM